MFSSHAEPFEVICVRQDVQDTSTLFYNCGVQPPLSGVTLSCDIDGKPLESCTIVIIVFTCRLIVRCLYKGIYIVRVESLRV